MITEDYVGLETAKLLKKHGFLKGVDLRLTQNLSFYDNYGLCHNLNKYYDSLIQDKIDFIVAPTLQMVMKWLRKEYDLHIIALPYAPIDRSPYHPGEADVVYIGQIFRGVIPIDTVGRSIIRLSPESVYEEAIKYCLENLV